jgi:hypothetical protein
MTSKVRQAKSNGRAEALPFWFGNPTVATRTWGTRIGDRLFGGHFFLFAFYAHEFEFALFGFDGCGGFRGGYWNVISSLTPE